MILSKEEAIELIKQPHASDALSEAMELQTTHKLHISGEGFEENLKRIENFESEAQFEIKKQFSRASTPRIFKAILNQFRKVFRAQGFNRIYNFKNSDQNLVQDFMDYLENVARGGISLDKFMKVVWHKVAFEDFNGIMLVELPEVQEEIRPEPFIVFKPLDWIHDIHTTGSKIEYVIGRTLVSNNGRTFERFRVIDDLTDRIFIRENSNIIAGTKTVINDNGEFEEVEDILPNIWGYVPAIQPTVIFRDINMTELKLSFISVIMNDADEYLSVKNDHTVSVKLHQHPIFYSYPTQCPTCNGTKNIEITVDGTTSDHACVECKGSGKVPFYKKDPSKGITLPEPEDGQPFKAEAPCGYVTPDLDSLKEQRVELDVIERNIEKGALGTEGVLNEKTKQETLGGKQLDLEPLIDLLNDYSANGEFVETFLTDTIGIARYGSVEDTTTTTGTYENALILWGRRYFLKSLNQLRLEYADSKKAGFPDSFLREILEEIIFTEFDTDPNAMKRSLILLDLEPFPTYILKELTDMGIASREDLTMKQYFNDYVERFEKEFGDIVIFEQDKEFSIKIKNIQDKLITFNKEKLTENGETDQSEVAEA